MFNNRDKLIPFDCKAIMIIHILGKLYVNILEKKINL